VADGLSPRVVDGILPEAGSIKGLMLLPQPARGWGALTSYPATLRSSTR
jgi:hypothetical protein